MQGRGGRGGAGGPGRGAGGPGRGGRDGGRGYENVPAPAVNTSQIQFEKPNILKTPPMKHASVARVTGKRITDSNVLNDTSKKRTIKPATGEPTTVMVNRVLIEFKNSFAHTLYRVDISPDIQQPAKRKKVAHMAFEILGKNEKASDENLLVFDSGNLMLQFAGQPFVQPNSAGETVQVALDQDNQFKVDVKLTTYHKDPNPYQAFGVALQSGLSSEGMVSIRGKYYNPSQAIQVPEHKCELYPGIDMSLHSTECGIQLQLDQVFKHVRTDTILDLLKNGTRQDDLIGKIGMCTYETERKKSRQTFDITEFITDKNADTFKFVTPQGETTLANYFLKKYNLKVTDKKQPLIKSVSRKTNNREPEIRYFLPEFARLAGETESMKKDKFRRMDLIKKTAAPPEMRMSYIDKYLKDMKSPKLELALKKYGIRISTKFLQVPATILASPPMKFKEKETKGAAWETIFRERSLPLFRANPIKKLAVIGADEESAGFVNDQMEHCRKQFGFDITDYDIEKFAGKLRNADDCVRQCNEVAKQGFTFVYIVLDRPNEQLYAACKRALCKHGIPSQVFCKSTIQKAQLTKATKITLQVVTKAGGAPWAVKLPFTAPTMMFGIAMHGTKDTFHRDVGNKDKTMGAFVASLNSVASDYYSVPVLVRGKTQVFTPVKDSLEKHIKEAAEAFNAKNKAWPRNLIVYRDGGAEGDYSEILKNEVSEFLKAATAISSRNEKQPCSLTFVLVFKKTGARIFQTGYKNPVPGTLVDKYITSSAVQEFYLQSHNVDQGSASATKYFVLHDDSQIENLTTVTFGATHAYYNWNGTIPTPAPLKYAEKLAAFAGGILGTDEVHPNLKHHLYYL